MKRVLLVLVTGLMLGAFAATQAKLPAPAPKTDAEKAAAAEKDAATKAKDAADLAKAQDKAVANYKRNHAAMGKK
ncbi:MAG TPA: hypothetical protein VGJ74_01545 [Burkholderiales bacterium]|jgi:hypothetical protein